jgi:hypothetical protein
MSRPRLETAEQESCCYSKLARFECDKDLPCLCPFLLVSWGGLRLSPLGTSATNWPIVPARDDRWWMCSSRWNENWQRKPKYSEKTCLSVTLSTTNPTWFDLVSNLGRRGGKPATNRLSYGTAFVYALQIGVMRHSFHYFKCHLSYRNCGQDFFWTGGGESLPSADDSENSAFKYYWAWVKMIAFYSECFLNIGTYNLKLTEVWIRICGSTASQGCTYVCMSELCI